MKPFQIKVPDAQIADLRARLSRTIWPSRAGPPGWEYGTDLAYQKEICRYWAQGFDWRVWEAKLNGYPQFLTTVESLAIHFLHIRSTRPDAAALLLIHGWPSSVFEYLKIIPLLSDFDLVIPSLPGHGFSEAATTPGLSIYRAAELWHQLMTRVLGYSRYFAQGGDWGAYAASRLGFLYPETVRGIHLSYVVGGLIPFLDSESPPLTNAENEMLEKRRKWDRQEGGYEHLHSTKPQTLAFALCDSPSGLAAWILEKWNSWTDCRGNLESKFTKDELLANVALYWFTNTAGSAARLYFETRTNPWLLRKGEMIRVPTAIASFPKELVVSPREWAQRLYAVTHWTDMPRGGHFAAIEEPALLAEDIRTFCRTLA